MIEPIDLQNIWHEEIPISKAMGINIESFDGVKLVVTAPLAANVNVHQTGCVGSLYAINALCGWGMVFLQLDHAGIKGEIVIADGQIHYHRPVTENIRAVCRFEGQQDNLAQLSDSGKTRFNLTSTIECQDKEAAVFSGVYAVRLQR